MDFKEKYGEWSVVLGASMGIGAACARELASKGISVVLVARSADKLEALAEEIKKNYHVDAKALPIDLLTEDAWEVLDKGLEGLNVGSAVYSAAYAYVGGFLAGDPDLEDRIMKLNVMGAIKFSKYFGNRFCRQERGGLVYHGSSSGYFSTPFMALYSATKGFEIALAESLYGEFKLHNVDVTVGIIGSVDTPGLRGLYPNEEAYAALKPIDPAIVAADCIAALGEQAAVVPYKPDRRNVNLLRKITNIDKQVKLVGQNTIDIAYKGEVPTQFPEENNK